MHLLVVSLALLDVPCWADSGRFITDKDSGETYTESQLLTLVKHLKQKSSSCVCTICDISHANPEAAACRTPNK
ncbi:hypothetical protein L596_000135 [Steinernema carpocapsae]|uniref:Uncharacterized protein n=1 Tax=Steinernema carpocapsae TaxID=34508 RepID=A0A4U8UGY8_STECR|nr:hypothetical protein L596_000135 [Steinernema carpocapsae]